MKKGENDGDRFKEIEFEEEEGCLHLPYRVRIARVYTQLEPSYIVACTYVRIEEDEMKLTNNFKNCCLREKLRFSVHLPA